jgi:hypothetical protein
VYADEFPAFGFRVTITYHGPALEAVRHDRYAPGVRAVITRDPGEMRRALIRDDRQP